MTLLILGLAFGFTAIQFISDIRAYRKLRGGRWGKVTGYMWGWRWVRVTDECVERVDEDYRK